MNKNEKINRLLVKAASDGNIDELKRLIPYADCLFQNGEALRKAAQFNNVSCIKLLLQHMSPNDVGLSVFSVVRHGTHQQLNTLLKNTQKSCLDEAHLGRALIAAAQIGHIDNVKALLPYSDASGIHQALLNAVNAQHIQIVKLLAAQTNTKQDNSIALQKAVMRNNQEIFDILYPLSEPKKALTALIKNGYQDIGMLRERVLAQEEQQTLLAHVRQTQQTQKKKIL